MYSEMGNNKPTGLISHLSWLIFNSWTKIYPNIQLQLQNSRLVQRVWKLPLWKGVIFKGAEPQKTLFSSDDDDEEIEKKSSQFDFKVKGFLHQWDWGEAIRGQFRGNKTLSSFLWQLWGHFVNQRQRNLQRRLLLNNPQLPIMTLLNNLSVNSLALSSRIIVLLIQWFACNFMSSFRHENDGFKFRQTENNLTETFGDKLVNSTLMGFANWDGQYFLHVAVHGYTEEKMLAFFPLFPKTVYYLSQIVNLFVGSFIGFSSLVLAVGWILNTALFVNSANMLYDLVKITNKNLDPTPVIFFFCFNPASIFFSSFYSESLFIFLTLKVLLSLYDEQTFVAWCWASIGTLCRSNGILNFGFIAAFILQKHVKQYFEMKISRQLLLANFLRTAFICVFGLVPFAAFQQFAITQFCNTGGLSLGQTEPSYCKHKMLPYQYVQQNYWNVGAFRYFEMKQIPNFILAFPVLYCTWKMFSTMFVDLMASQKFKSELFNIYIAVYGIFLAVFCFTCVHVQVSTRLILSAFPYFYIHIVEGCRDEVVQFRQRNIHWTVKTLFVQLWSISYFILGTIAFSLGFPWT